MSQDIMAFLQAPPTWAALLILLAGILLINYVSDFLAFVVVFALCGFIWLALGTFVASFAAGWPAVAFWFVLACVLLYNTGWHVEKERYIMLTLNLVILLVLVTFVGTQVYQLSFWMSFGASLISVILYLVIGLGVARIKWGLWNRRMLDESLNGKARYLLSLKERHAIEAGRLRVYSAQQPGTTEGQSAAARRGPVLEEPEFNEQQLGAIAALPADFRALQKIAVPVLLNEAYTTYVSAKLRVPDAFESKQKFFAWLAAWPGVFIHMILAEVIERLWKWAYEFIENHLNEAQRKIFKGHEEFLKLP